MTSVTPDPDSVDALEQEPSVQLTDSALYFNREVSWLDFNDRVLQLVEDATVPLLERVKFCAIYTSNLDEFFMVRVAGLHDQLEAGITLYDAFYRWCRDATDETHNWPTNKAKP